MPDSHTDWFGLVQQHLLWYPLMDLRDIYKLLYQGVMGSEHLVSSPEAFTHQLVSEFEPLLPDPSGRLLEPVRPDQSLLRLNLSAYKSRHSQVSSLITPLLATGQISPGDLATLQATWMGFTVSCAQGLIPGFSLDEIQSFTAWLEASGFPPVHHSQVYRQQYHPAYRLISAQSALQLGLDHAG